MTVKCTTCGAVYVASGALATAEILARCQTCGGRGLAVQVEMQRISFDRYWSRKREKWWHTLSAFDLQFLASLGIRVER